MKIESRKAFDKDIKMISEPKLANQILLTIDFLERCLNIHQVSNLKKMHADGKYYRIRIGDYRLGLKVKNDTIILLRFLHRKEIYKYFP